MNDKSITETVTPGIEKKLKKCETVSRPNLES